MGYLRVYLGDALKTQVPIDREQFTIGRAETNDLVLSNLGVSSRHATIANDGSKFTIVDNESTNGVFVNNKRVKMAELKYWDEIQIFNYKLKFMALTSREDGDDPDVTGQKKAVSKTQVVDLSGQGLQSLLQQYQKKSAFLTLYHADGKESRIPVPEKSALTVGRSKGCDIRTGGWFAPKKAAEVERVKKGYQLTPYPRGKVLLNDEQVQTPKKLKDGDNIKVRDLSLHFFHRVVKRS